jgi:hypothetical protein
MRECGGHRTGAYGEHVFSVRKRFPESSQSTH